MSVFLRPGSDSTDLWETFDCLDRCSFPRREVADPIKSGRCLGRPRLVSGGRRLFPPNPRSGLPFLDGSNVCRRREWGSSLASSSSPRRGVLEVVPSRRCVLPRRRLPAEDGCHGVRIGEGDSGRRTPLQVRSFAGPTRSRRPFTPAVW